MNFFRALTSNFTSYSQRILGSLLRWIGRQTPNIPYVRAIPNRILKPVHSLLRIDGGVFDVMGFQMHLEPTQCVDGNLYFAPHLYDRDEIKLLQSKMPEDGVFVDVGGNIGFWSLYFSWLFPKSRIFVIEANPVTFAILCENIKVNAFQNVMPIQLGVSDEVGEFPLWCNDTGNRGADSFLDYSANRTRCISVAVKPLLDILVSAGVLRIDVMKIDIEGLELRVLTRFFAEAPRELWPSFICAEVSHVPNIVNELKKIGYTVVLAVGENCVFELISVSNFN